MNMHKFPRPGFVAQFLVGVSVCAVIVAATLSTATIAQTFASGQAKSAHPALADCQKRFREAANSANVAVVPTTMAEVCLTVEQSCKPETESNSDCQKALASADKHVATSFGARETKPNRSR